MNNKINSTRKKLSNRVRLAIANLIELLNGIEVKEDYPVKGCISVSQRLGWQRSIGMTVKIQPDTQHPYFEIDRYGSKIPFDLKIGDSRCGIPNPSHNYMFYKGQDIGLVEKFTVSAWRETSEVYSNGRRNDTKYSGDRHFITGTSIRFGIRDYIGDYRPLIRSLELRLGRKIIDKKTLAKQD